MHILVPEMPGTYITTYNELPDHAQRQLHSSPTTLLLPTDEHSERLTDHGRPNQTTGLPPRACNRNPAKQSVKVTKQAFIRGVNKDPTDMQLYNYAVGIGIQPEEYAWVLAIGPTRHPENNHRLHHPALHRNHWHPVPANTRDLQPRPNAQLCGNYAWHSHCPDGPTCRYMHTPDFLQDTLCKRYLRGADCSRRRCDHLHGTGLNDPTGHEVSRRSIFWNTTPDAITLTPHPPTPTQQELNRFPTSIYVPIPLPDICTTTAFVWDDSAYGLPPPPPLSTFNLQDTPYTPNLDQNRFQVATELLARTVATHRTLPLEASTTLLNHIRGIVNMFSYNGHTRSAIFHDYDAGIQEVIGDINPRTLTSRDDNRPTEQELQGYMMDWHRRARDLLTTIDRIARTLGRRRLERRPAPPAPDRLPPSGPLSSLPEHTTHVEQITDDPWDPNPPARPPSTDAPPNPWLTITAAPEPTNDNNAATYQR